MVIKMKDFLQPGMQLFVKKNVRNQSKRVTISKVYEDGTFRIEENPCCKYHPVVIDVIPGLEDIFEETYEKYIEEKNLKGDSNHEVR